MHERPICQLSIDRSSSAATSISITNPSINMLEASGKGRSSLVQAEVALQAFSFGPFRIVPHARLVERDGLPMPLGSRAFDLLCVLVSRPGKVVSKGELMAKVWPDLTVEESNLRFHIAQLRRALSDDQGGERYVTNVPGAGLLLRCAGGLRGVSVHSTPLRLRRFVMLTDQHLFRPEGIVSDAKGQVPSQTSAEFVRTYNAQAHEIVDAITAAVTRAQAGLNWLRAEPPDLEEVRQALNFIASDGQRAAELVIRLRALIKKVPTADAAPNP